MFIAMATRLFQAQICLSVTKVPLVFKSSTLSLLSVYLVLWLKSAVLVSEVEMKHSKRKVPMGREGSLSKVKCYRTMLAVDVIGSFSQ